LSPAQEQLQTHGRDFQDDDIVIASDEATSPCPSLLAMEEDREQHSHDEHRTVVRCWKTYVMKGSWKRRKKWYGNGTKMSLSSEDGIFSLGAFDCELKTLDTAHASKVELVEHGGEEDVISLSEASNRNEWPCRPISSGNHNQEEGDLASPEEKTIERTDDSSNASLGNHVINMAEIDPLIEPSTMQESEADLVKEECNDYRSYSKHSLLYSDPFSYSPSSKRGKQSIDDLLKIDTLQHEVVEQRYGSDENDSSTFDSIYESSFSPNIHARCDSNDDKVASVNLMFDDQEYHELTKEKRRSYGDSKPVWTSTKVAPRNESDGIVGLIGWDDAKCRPIYRATSRHYVPSNYASSWTDELSDKSDPRPLKGSDVYQKRPHKKKVYATLFKKTGLSRAMRDEMDVNAPSPAYDLTVASPFHFLPEASCIRTSSNKFSRDEIGDVDGKKNHVDSRQQSDASRSINIDEESLDDNVGGAHRVQPHSKSSLASARAFFRYLDSNHILTILDQDEPPAALRNKL
jgi:hypothetical protein